MEGKLFDWKEFLDSNESFNSYYDCTLVVAIGNYPIGHKVDSIEINFLGCEIRFYEPEQVEPYAVFKLTYSVGEQIK